MLTRDNVMQSSVLSANLSRISQVKPRVNNFCYFSKGSLSFLKYVLGNMKRKERSSCGARIMVLDTETTGFPLQPGLAGIFPLPRRKSTIRRRLVQLGYIVLDKESKEELMRQSHLVKPDKTFVIPDKMVHGISHEHASQHGKSLNAVLRAFEKDLDGVECIVAHNADFDLSILGAELARAGERKLLSKVESLPIFCTGKKSMKLCNLRRGGKLKMPKLREAYSLLVTKEQPTSKAHDALGDCELCADIYRALTTSSKKRDSK